MKSVSFLRSWKVKVSKSSKDDEGRLPLQYPIERVKESTPAGLQSPSPSIASPSPASPPTLSLASPFRENFSTSVETALQYHRGTPELRHSVYPHDSSSRQNYSPGPKPRARPSFTNLNAATLSSAHGPPMNPKHGPSNILQTQLSTINSSTAKAGPSYSHHSSPPRNQTPQHDFTETVAPKVRSPTRVKFDTPSQSLDTPSRHSKFSSTPVPNKGYTEGPVERRRDTQSASVSPTGCAKFLPHGDSTKLSQERDSVSPKHRHLIKDGHPAIGHGVGEKQPYRGLTSSRSTPHLRPAVEFDRPPPPPLPMEVLSSSDFTSLFPAPPPLVIRKKRPQPLVLQPQQGSPSFPPKASPISSSADSTPVATPQSSRTQFAASPKPPRAIPPRLHSPPTSPLPPPPNMPPPYPKHALPRQSIQSLKPSRSASNLRRDKFLSSIPTHRMTSSDPISEVPVPPMQDRTSSPLKLHAKSNGVRNSPQRFVRREEGAPLPQEGRVQWGYAL